MVSTASGQFAGCVRGCPVFLRSVADFVFPERPVFPSARRQRPATVLRASQRLSCPPICRPPSRPSVPILHRTFGNTDWPGTCNPQHPATTQPLARNSARPTPGHQVCALHTQGPRHARDTGAPGPTLVIGFFAQHGQGRFAARMGPDLGSIMGLNLTLLAAQLVGQGTTIPRHTRSRSDTTPIHHQERNNRDNFDDQEPDIQSSRCPFREHHQSDAE